MSEHKSTSVLDDFEFIAKRQKVIQGSEKRRPCAIRSQSPVSECWCYCAGESGNNLPCPPTE